MKRVLTGIQASGNLHIGNYFGAMKPVLDYQGKSDLFVFVVDLHSLTSVRDPQVLRNNTNNALFDFLALGLDPDKSTFWVQSDVPEVLEFNWVLSCITGMGLMERMHAFKDKTAKGIDANVGLFSYPILMAADILSIKSEVVPVGKDQTQHIEVARDIAEKFNSTYGELFTIPVGEIKDEIAVIPGTDGEKMSKSYKNTIPIFGSEEEVKSACMKVVTDSSGVDDKKSKDLPISKLLKLFDDGKFYKSFLSGGVGYGDAKKKLFEFVWEYFREARVKREKLEKNLDYLIEVREKGAKKVKKVMVPMLEKMKEMVGL